VDTTKYYKKGTKEEYAMGFNGYYSAEREAKLIDDLAKFAVNNDLETITHIMLESVKPIAGVFGPLTFMLGFPIFTLFGTWSLDLGNLLKDNPREKIDLILKRIDELVVAKGNTAIFEDRKGWGSRLKKLFGG
jgi:hypothetical protein